MSLLHYVDGSEAARFPITLLYDDGSSRDDNSRVSVRDLRDKV